MKHEFNNGVHSSGESGGACAASPGNRRPISDIFHEIVTHVTEIVHSEMRLARTELRQELTDIAQASVFLVAGTIFALYAFGLVLLAAVYALGERAPMWAAALIVAGGVIVPAAALLLIGRKKLQQASLKPAKTIQSLEENVQWFKTQTR